MYSSNGQITHFSASDLVERPKECVNRWSSQYRGAQSPVIYQCTCQWFGNTLVFSVIKFQVCGNFVQCLFWTVPVYLITKYNDMLFC